MDHHGHVLCHYYRGISPCPRYARLFSSRPFMGPDPTVDSGKGSVLSFVTVSYVGPQISYVVAPDPIESVRGRSRLRLDRPTHSKPKSGPQPNRIRRRSPLSRPQPTTVDGGTNTKNLPSSLLKPQWSFLNDRSRSGGGPRD